MKRNGFKDKYYYSYIGNKKYNNHRLISKIYSRWGRMYTLFRKDGIWYVDISQHEKYFDRWANSRLLQMKVEDFITMAPMMPDLFDLNTKIESGNEVFLES